MSLTKEARTGLSDPKRVDLKVKQKKAVLVAVVLPGAQRELEDPLDELKGLAKTAGVVPVATLVQNRLNPDARSCVGKGKLEELKMLAEDSGADTILFDNNLTPSQARVLEKEIGKVIVDRSELILSIFAEHARTHEAQLQVQLAQQLYMRTRLKRLWTHLERTEGATGSTGGPGEQQIEIDRRLIDTKVADLKAQLKELEQRRERQVAHRRSQLTVSLVGYTNAGKSTLMRALTGSDVYVADQLFATLDTRTRVWTIPHLGKVLLSDTVGFIRDLPHNLVASFRSTLEEARHADVLLHVVDASSPSAEQQIATVNEVLKEIGIDGSQAILVLNKSDAVKDRSILDALRANHATSVSVSALERVGFEQLASLVSERLGNGFIEMTLETSVSDGKLFAFLARHAEVLEQTYTEERSTIRCRLPRRYQVELSRQFPNVHIATDDPALLNESNPPDGGHEIPFEESAAVVTVP
ncbi:MAG: GTPase HflX [Planctomycetota bacterium]|nr:GTPase HflX [Planctomycetota bacterium]